MSRPNLQGGPLSGIYEFHSAIFRWGPSDDEGSEHCIDYVRYALELQLVHAKRGLDTTVDVVKCKVRDAIAIVSLFFQVRLRIFTSFSFLFCMHFLKYVLDTRRL